MTPAELVARFPVIWHMTESESWPQIQKHGLLSTSAILDLYGVSGERRRALERCRRPESVVLKDKALGKMTIRDQKPLNEKLLARCLTGMSPEDWYLTLNQRVFFWVQRARLDRLLCARAYRNRAHTILAIGTDQLVAAHENAITLAKINSGAIHPGSLAARGAGTFEPLRTYPSKDVGRVVELAVDYAVPDAATMVSKRERRRCESVDSINRVERR